MDVSFWANCNLEALRICLRILPLKQSGLIEGGDVAATDGVVTCWRGPSALLGAKRVLSKNSAPVAMLNQCWEQM